MSNRIHVKNSFFGIRHLEFLNKKVDLKNNNFGDLTHTDDACESNYS
jgi:hypothetical protein